MNLIEVFSMIVKAYANNQCVTVVTNYENTAELLRRILTLSGTFIVSVEIADKEWRECEDVYLLSLGDNGSVYCQPAMDENGKIHRGGGLYIIDENTIGALEPSDFVFEDESSWQLLAVE